jgi:5-methylcytosine-specific restriction endonuclease McrA
LWTDAKLKSFIVGGLRAAYRRFPPKYETLKDSFVGKKENKKTKRQAMHYRCKKCAGDFPATEVNVDHIVPAIDPKEGFVDWNTFIERLFCDKKNLQTLCKSCHDKKTKKELKQRVDYKKDKTK